MIGTGASAVQFIPEIAPEVGELLVFQRTPPWFGPTPDYHDEVSPGLRWLYGHVPSYSEWNRFWIFWRMGDGVLDAVRVDDDVGAEGRSRSAWCNDIVRMMLTGYLEARVRGPSRPAREGRADVPAGAKRMLRDNGVWAAHAEARQRPVDHGADLRDHADAASSPTTARNTTST